MIKQTKEERRAYFKRYYLEHKEYFSNRKKNNREHANILNRESRIRAKQRDLKDYRKRDNESQTSYRLRRKQLVFSHYSNGSIKCVVCGESRLACLSIDHIAGGGTQHKLSLKLRGGHDFYGWLVRSRFPEGYQVLCMNCQFVKRVMNREIGWGASPAMRS